MTTVVPTIQTLNPPSPTALQDAQQREFSKTINCARPGTIVDYDPGAEGVRPPTATVQIAQLQVTSIAVDGTQTFAPYPPLQLVPVYFAGGGNWDMTWPVAQGDECLLIFSDREIDNWFTNGAGLAPTTTRLHDLSDAFCIVGIRSGPNARGGVSTNSVQIRSKDYSGPSGQGELLEVGAGKIQLIADDVVLHGRNRASFDAGGTGFVYTPSHIDTYTDGVPSDHHSPSPPIVP